MRKTNRALAIPAAAVALAIGLTGCASSLNKDITVITEAEENINFSEFRTYAWAAAAAVIHDPDMTWAPPDLDVGAEVHFLVNRELRKQGFTEIVEDPDLLLIYAVGIDMVALDIVIDEDEAERFEETPTGALLIALADYQTREYVWGGYAEATLLEEPDTELTKKRLDFAITEMFRRYPN